MDKLDMRTRDLAKENYLKLKELFPEAVTETVGENGDIVRAIDADKLQELISGTVVDGPKERYQFTWPDKKKAIVLGNAPTTKTLRLVRDKSVGRDGTPGSIDTQNIYIEGDNLDALKLLRETYLGKVKMIYIDPPYNTGRDFIYKDKFAQKINDYLDGSSEIDEEGNQLVQNLESNGRFHTDWLNMMYPRLRLARDLLASDGVIFISIDDHEENNLQNMCNEIFGAGNFVAKATVKINPRGRNLDQYVAKTCEPILIYVRNCHEPDAVKPIAKNESMLAEYTREDQFGQYRPIGLRNRNQAFNPHTRPSLYYPLYVNPANGRVSTSADLVHSVEVYPDAPDGIKTCWTWSKSKVDKENDLVFAEETSTGWRVFRKDYASKDGAIPTTLAKSLWDEKEFNNDQGKSSIKALFGANVMDFPKSPYLMERMIEMGTEKDSLILDFFSGSATLAHACMLANSKEHGNRTYIMVQLPERTPEKSISKAHGLETICDIGEERIRRAGKKIREDTGADIDYGFRVFCVDSSNVKDVCLAPGETHQMNMETLAENIKEGRVSEDLLFQTMLQLGIPLSATIEETEIDGKKVYAVDGTYLLACFDPEVSESTVEAIAKRHPFYAVFRDSSMQNDSVAANFEQIFDTYSPDTTRKVV